ELQQPLLEPGLVSSALGGGDDVDEALEHGVVAGAPAQSQVNLALALQFGRHHVPGLLQHGHRPAVAARSLDPPRVGDPRIRGQVLDELTNAAVEAEVLGCGLLTALIADADAESRHEERRLAGTGEQLLALEAGALREDLRVGPVADAGAGDALRDLADDA